MKKILVTGIFSLALLMAGAAQAWNCSGTGCCSEKKECAVECNEDICVDNMCKDGSCGKGKCGKDKKKCAVECTEPCAQEREEMKVTAADVKKADSAVKVAKADKKSADNTVVA